MRIAELSQTSGVPVPTIKYYLREGLLPAGELTSPNQARYDDRHVQRLRLVRALLDIGRLPIAIIRDLLGEIDGGDPDVHHVLGRALPHGPVGRGPVDAPRLAAARAVIDELVTRRGWRVVMDDAPALQAAAEVVAAFEELGAPDITAFLEGYADAAERIAVTDLEFVGQHQEPAAMLYRAVIGSVLGDTLFAALRRLAQEHESAKRFGFDPAKAEDC